jgi:hypothetical protein
MTSAPVCDPLADHLITPENAALLFIDYQPSQLAGVRSMDHALLVKNAVSTVRTIKTFGGPGRALDLRCETELGQAGDFEVGAADLPGQGGALLEVAFGVGQPQGRLDGPPGSSAPPPAGRCRARCPHRTARLPGRQGTWPARRRRPGDHAASPATASATRSPPGGGAGDPAAPPRRTSRRLPGGRPPRPGVPGQGQLLRAPGPARERVCMAALRAALHKQDGEPMRLTRTVCPGALSPARVAAQFRATAKAGRNQHIHGCPWKIGSAVLRSRESP